MVDDDREHFLEHAALDHRTQRLAEQVHRPALLGRACLGARAGAERLGGDRGRAAADHRADRLAADDGVAAGRHLGGDELELECRVARRHELDLVAVDQASRSTFAPFRNVPKREFVSESTGDRLP